MHVTYHIELFFIESRDHEHRVLTYLFFCCHKLTPVFAQPLNYLVVRQEFTFSQVLGYKLKLKHCCAVYEMSGYSSRYAEV
jgi:hypothetical protein